MFNDENANRSLTKLVAQKLRASALTACASDAATPHMLATAMIGVGVELATIQMGLVGAAEWLRFVADEIEADAVSCGQTPGNRIM